MTFGNRQDVAAVPRPVPYFADDVTLRVLLVEDDDIDAKLVSLCAAPIESFKMNIDRVVSSNDARIRLAETRYDLCIVDFWLGCESSIRFLAELDGPRGGIPALVLTSLSTPDIRKMCVMAGAAVFLGKADLNVAALENAVIRALASSPITLVPQSLASTPIQPDLQTPRELERLDVHALQSMTETVRFGLFETFWADRYASRLATTGDRSVDIGNLVLGAVEAACGIWEDRCQTVNFRKPDPAIRLPLDPAMFFFIVFELLSRASRLCAEGGELTIELDSNPRELQVEFRGGARIDATAGALALGPLCAEILATHHATFADTSGKDGGFLLMVRFSTETIMQAH